MGSREEMLLNMRQTVDQYEREGILEKEKILEEPTFTQNVGNFWGSLLDVLKSELNQLQNWQHIQGTRGADYIKRMRELSDQKPYGENE